MKQTHSALLPSEIVFDSNCNPKVIQRAESLSYTWNSYLLGLLSNQQTLNSGAHMATQSPKRVIKKKDLANSLRLTLAARRTHMKSSQKPRDWTCTVPRTRNLCLPIFLTLDTCFSLVRLATWISLTFPVFIVSRTSNRLLKPSLTTDAKSETLAVFCTARRNSEESIASFLQPQSLETRARSRLLLTISTSSLQELQKAA